MPQLVKVVAWIGERFFRIEEQVVGMIVMVLGETIFRQQSRVTLGGSTK